MRNRVNLKRDGWNISCEVACLQKLLFASNG
jgi:hypothetical protein